MVAARRQGRAHRAHRTLAIVAAVAAAAPAAGCRGKGGGGHGADDAAAAPRDGARPADDDGGVADAMPSGDAAWQALAALPGGRPRWRVDLARRVDLAERGLTGPLIADGVAIVGGTAVGVAGVDVATGDLEFQRPPPDGDTGPAVLEGDRWLSVGDCPAPLAVGRGDRLVGCYAVLAARGQAAYGAGSIVVGGGVEPPAGRREVRVDGRHVYVGRDDAWVAFDLDEPPRGEARAQPVDPRTVPPAPTAPRLRGQVHGFAVDVWAADDALELRYHDPDILAPRAAVRAIAAAPGAVWAAPGDDAAARAFTFGDGVASLQPVEIGLERLIPIALGAPLPGIQLLAVAHDDAGGGFVAAIRLDATLQHDYVAAYTATGALAWVWRLPPPPGGGRALPVGVAITGDGVVVFHDGAAVTGLPPP